MGFTIFSNSQRSNIFRRTASCAFLIATAWLTGCVTVVKDSEMYHRNPERAKKVETTDSAELFRRWGDYVHATGKYWVGRESYSIDGDYIVFWNAVWLVPGASIRRTDFDCSFNSGKCDKIDSIIEYDPEEKTLYQFASSTQSSSSWVKRRSLTVSADGTVKDVFGGSYDKERNEWLWRQNRYFSVTAERYEALFQEARQEVAATRRAESRKSSEFWGAVAQSALIGTQAAAQAYSEQQAAQSKASNMAQRELAAIQERERLAAQSAANRRALPASQIATAPPTAMRPTSPAPALAPARSPAPSQPVMIATPSRPPEPSKPDTAGSTRQAFPEAIFVCTKPNEVGNFGCDSPVTGGLSGGPKSGLSEWATPERMVSSMSSACPDARRLASSTHLVWGCGFGATNNSNSMDRSSGVDVAGRRTYYCSDRETSCRRVEP
ncbi:hypothetical protein [Variovorax terrae]|uniref:Uncharacterized protein n=1 Tax=Variovorax terrae TaxID=2923278 RepID=A0A9X1VTW2_9BURK|nr:hypothetical protein [Variovorax terrae]MCJ0763194.1 hypothetical protein [Variovorax terrae]